MPDELALPVHFNNEEISFPMEMIRWGYTHRFKIHVYGHDYFFEPDEEGIYRAIIESTDKPAYGNTELLKVIGQTLAELMQ
jgi:hypothetical protein